LEDSSPISSASETESAQTKQDRLPLGSALSLATIDELAEQIVGANSLDVAH
jgi:hypothetical protein